MIKKHIFHSNFMKAALFGLFLSTFSTGVAFAETNASVDKTLAFTSEVSSIDKELSKLQEEIDQYVFVDHADEISKKDFMVTNTGVVDGVVEVGILPYSKANAQVITDAFGTDKVKVVEGEDVMMYAFDEGILIEGEETQEVAPETAPDIQFDDAIFDKLDSVNNLLFEVNAKELEEKGISIMSTQATETAVEIGVLPYTKENVNYINDLVGKDLIKVLEGKEPELMATSGMAVDPVLEEGKVVATAYDSNIDPVKLTSDSENTKTNGRPSPVVILSIAGVIILLGGTAYVLSNKKLD